MKRSLKTPSGRVVEVDALDRDCGDCEFATVRWSGPDGCVLFRRAGESRDTWGVRLEECLDAEKAAKEVDRAVEEG